MEYSERQSKGRGHVDGFLRAEQRGIEELAAEMGRDTVARLDRILLRELIHERKHAAMDEMFGSKPVPKQHDVVIQMRGARAASPRPVRSAEEQARCVKQVRATSEVLVSRLSDSLERNEIPLRKTFWIVPAAHVETSSDGLRTIASRNDVMSIVSNKPRLAICLDTSRGLIGADQAAALGFNGSGITVAVIDTGVDAAHPALAGVITSQVDLTGEGVGDLVGHGTHCAGVVASQDGRFTGIAPGARVADIKVMMSPGTTTPAIAISGVQAATTTAGVRVASCSWGFSHAGGAWLDPPQDGQPDGTCVLCAAVDAAVSTGVFFAIAAGNENNDSCSTYDTHLRCPSLSANAITVAASDKSDAMAGFSSVGPTPDGRAKPDITAPGVDIGSCRAAGTSMGTPIDDNFTRADGTSMATPHIAGVAALMLSKTGTATPAAIKSAMMSTAVDIGAPSIQEGAGRVDALASVNAI